MKTIGSGIDEMQKILSIAVTYYDLYSDAAPHMEARRAGQLIAVLEEMISAAEATMIMVRDTAEAKAEAEAEREGARRAVQAEAAYYESIECNPANFYADTQPF